MKTSSLWMTLLIAIGTTAAPVRSAPPKPRPDLYKPVTDVKAIERLASAIARAQDLDAEKWLHSLEQTRIYLELTKREEPDFVPQATMPVTEHDLERARQVFGKAFAGPSPAKAIAAALQRGELRAFRLIPGTSDGKLRVTRYTSARVEARAQKTGPFKVPLHRLPPDAMRDPQGKLPTKQQVHAGALLDRAPVIAWLEPDAEADLQMEGSGLLEFPGGQILSVNYEGNNGYKWTEELDDVKQELKRKHGKNINSYWPLFKKRHTFQRALVLEEFKHLKLKPGQFLGFDRPFYRKMPITARVSAAMDPGMIPSGAVGLVVSPEGPSRLVKIDDQGAAFIDRPDKIDLFWGSYSAAEISSGKTEGGNRVDAFPDWGELYFFAGAPAGQPMPSR